MACREGVPVSRRLDFIAARFPLPEHFKRVLPCFLPLSLLQSKRKADDDKQRLVRSLPLLRVTRSAEAKPSEVSGAHRWAETWRCFCHVATNPKRGRPALTSSCGGHVLIGPSVLLSPTVSYQEDHGK